MRRAGPSLILLTLASLGGCAAPEDLVVQTAPLELEPASASIRILSPGDGATVGTPMTLRYSLDLTDQAPSSVPLTIRSTLRDPIWTGNVGRSGESEWTGEAPEGSQEITIEGIDRQGNPFSDTVRVLVREEPLPECVILAPITGTTVQAGVEIQFEAFAQDFDGSPIDVFWRSSLEGGLALGTTFERRMVITGEHLITIEGVDEFARTCRDEVVLFVE